METAYTELASAAATGRRCYSIGPLIHNPPALEDLAGKGLEVLDARKLPAVLSGAVLIIRAHGICPLLETALMERGGRVVDATCPKVKASQMRARDLSRAGRPVFLAGERAHAEVAGIQGYAPGCLVVGKPEEAARAARQLAQSPIPNPQSPALLAQTTISPGEYDAIAAAIGQYFPDIEVIDTICPATRERQEALRELCREVDAALIAGGRGSANTRRLLAIARESGLPAWIAESAADLPPGITGFARLGLSAGASTPDWVIDRIEAALGGSS
jgi:4-hydroxy-3-methylbut-2-enyl diphosphate reductase